MGAGYIFGEKHREYIRRAYRSVFNVAEGAVRAGKTIDNVFVFASLLERSPDKFHLATGSTLGNAKLNIGDCNGLGLEHLFRGRCKYIRYKGNEALSVMTAVGERIIVFAGGKNSDSYKKIRGNSYGMWIATEINLHADTFIKEAMNRTLAAVDRRVFWDLNPSSPGHFIYRDYLDKYAEAGGDFYNYCHFTIRDNPLIDEARMAEIVSQYDPDSVWYRRDILGERCAAEGLIYRTFADDPRRFRLDSLEGLSVEFINIGVDFGGNRSRTAFVATAFLSGQGDGYSGVAVVAERAVDGGKGEIDSSRINREMADFLVELRRKCKARVRYIFCDSEAQYLINGLRRHLAGISGFEGISVRDSAKRPIVDRIAFVNSLFSAGKLWLVSGCDLLTRGLCEAAWEPSSDRDRRLDNFSSDIDILDAFEYSVERYMGRIKLK